MRKQRNRISWRLNNMRLLFLLTILSTYGLLHSQVEEKDAISINEEIKKKYKTNNSLIIIEFDSRVKFKAIYKRKEKWFIATGIWEGKVVNSKKTKTKKEINEQVLNKKFAQEIINYKKGELSVTSEGFSHLFLFINENVYNCYGFKEYDDKGKPERIRFLRFISEINQEYFCCSK